MEEEEEDGRGVMRGKVSGREMRIVREKDVARAGCDGGDGGGDGGE